MYEYHSVIIESPEKNIITEGIITSFKNDCIVVLSDEKTQFDVNDKVCINIFNKINGCMNYEGLVREVKDNLIDIDSLIFVKEIQRRKHPRITVNIPLAITELKKETTSNISLSKPILMKAKNISIDGILLESFLDIPLDVHFNIDIPLNNSSLSLLTTTVRKYEENSMFYYGCFFELNNPEEKSILRKFIYQNYIQQIKHKNPGFSFYANRQH